MPIFDRSYQVPAPPAMVAAHLTSSIGDGENCLNIKKDALYVVTHDSLALVYLIEPTRDQQCTVRLVVNDAASVRVIFQDANIKAAWLKLLASPPPETVDSDARGVIAQRVAELVNTFKAGTPIGTAASTMAANSIPVGDPPTTEANPINAPAFSTVPSGVRPAWPLSADELRRSSAFSIKPIPVWLIVRVVLVLIVAGVGFLFANYMRGQLNLVISALNSPLNLSGVNLNPDSNWHSYNTNNIPNCTTLAAAGFSCYTALQNTDQTVTVILGGVPSSGTVDLGQVEKDSFVALQQQQPGLTRVKVYNIKLSQINAIRRDMIMPVRNTDLKHYGSQLYFHYKFTLFELTVEALSQDIYNAQLKNIEGLINGISFDP